MSVKCRNEGESSFNTGEPDSLENNKEKSKTDVLTGLYQRSKLDEMLETEYKRLKSCGVLVLDMNDLHKLNEEYGLEAGDEALCMVAQSLQKLKNDKVMSYRYSGDKLLVVASEYSKDEIRRLLDRWMESWNEIKNKSKMELSVAVGVAWDSAPVSVEELVAKADVEMYRNKELMKAGVPLEFYIQGEISCSYGLFNRKQFFDMIDYRCRDRIEDYCLISSDIEHFKIFNKWYGRKTGDEFLEEFAGILKVYEKKYNGIAAYMGGDNFAILMPDNKKAIDLMIDDLCKISIKYGNTIGFLPTFGAYRIKEENLNAVEMYDRAVEALTHISEDLKQRICYYDKERSSKEEDELHILTEVRDAIKEGQFTIYLQPKCQIKNRKIVGAEALVRWIHPVKGMISPGIFIPVLEKNGFISVLDLYVWELVCKQVRSWIDQGIEPVPVSINISRMDIMSVNVVEVLNGLMEKYHIDRKYIKIEITESAYVENDQKIVETVRELKKVGFNLMMDDFGSGYSSLNMLKQILVDTIKVDMKFLDMDYQNMKKGLGILKFVVNMSNEIDVSIVVEGVETEEQSDFLGKMGVRFAQGYLYYRPMPIEEFTKLISVEENVDRHGIYQMKLDGQHMEEMLEDMLIARQNRYKQIEIDKIRGGFFSYKAEGNQDLIMVSQSVIAMYGCETEEEFRELVGNSFIGMVHPEDRYRIQEEIDEQIQGTKWKMDYIEYRIITKDGEIRYISDYGHLEEDPNTGEPYFCVFILDVTDKMK